MTSRPAHPRPLASLNRPLRCHPASPAAVPLLLRVTVSAAPGPEAGLVLSYELSGDIQSLLLPEPGLTGAADGLWRHSCFEAFVGAAGTAPYREFNFSPSGQWAAYRFGAERQRDAAAEALAPASVPRVQRRQTAQALTLEVGLPAHALPAFSPGQPLLLGLNAVIEDRQGRLSYWALNHPKPEPDFHDQRGRVLNLSGFF